MPLALPSTREEFQSFRSFYAEELAPFLQRHEELRKSTLYGIVAIVAVAGSVFLAALVFTHDGMTIRPFLLWGSAILGSGAATARFTKTRNKITKGLLKRITAHLGFDYKREAKRPDFLEDLNRLGLIRRFNIEDWEDSVSGARHGLNFQLCEAHLKYRSRGKKKSTRTVFHGQFLAIDYPTEFLGETVIKRDVGILNRLSKPGKKFSNVGLVSAKFEKAFEAWSTDQVEARELIDPVMLERFEELDRLFDGAKFRAAFTGAKLLVAIEVGDALNMGTMFQKLDNPQRINKILKEFDLIFDLIDVAVKRVHGPMSGAFSVDDVKAG
ncbi:MAG: DUF3137 domain-containing protein [Marinicaulis sp.]|nr:DUF3137 domain-containing protein [Marinicaulis sp.]NNE41404.1 DUF3137 domain-containing protein [Marinicaulis sp.]